jgi:hypothetical protein
MGLETRPTGKGLVIAGLVVGLCSLIFSWIPIFNAVSFVLGPLAIVFGIIGLVKHKGGLAIASLATGALGLILTIVFVVLYTVAITEGIDEAYKNYDSYSSSSSSNSNSNSNNNSNSNSNSSNSSSSSTSSIEKDKLIGTWKEIDVDETYQFNADGTGKEVLYGSTYNFKWSLDGDKIKFDFADVSDETVSIKFEGNTLILDNLFEYQKQ